MEILERIGNPLKGIQNPEYGRRNQREIII